MVNYQEGKIYKIKSKQSEKYYIGSTTLDLEERLKQHKHDYKRIIEGKRKRNITSTELTKYNDCYIKLIKLFPCGSKKELEKEEGRLQKKYKNMIVNQMVAGGKTKEEQKEYLKQWKLDNHDRYLQKNLESVERRRNIITQCPCGSNIQKSRLYAHNKTDKHQQYLKNI